jgi:NADH dehydrogenase FAD-containing subunit
MILTAGIKRNDNILDHKNEIDDDFSLKEKSNIFLCGDVSSSPTVKTAHNAMIEGRQVAQSIIGKITGRKKVIKHRNWTILAVALGRHDGMITTKKNVFRIFFTGFLKWIVEKRVMIEFKYKIRLPI